MKKIIILFLIFLLLPLIVFRFAYKKQFLIFFKRSGILVHHNKKGQLNGEFIEIDRGILKKKTTFKNDVKDGWDFTYYDNGNIKSKIFYKLGKANGPEYSYYDNGSLLYRSTLKNGKRFGGIYWYNKSGKLDSYGTVDINGDVYLLCNYDKNGIVAPIKTFVSPKYYALNIVNNSIFVFNAVEGQYNELQDLYFTTATPPELNLVVDTKINNIEYKNLSVINNQIKLCNVLTRVGTYKIIIQPKYFDKYHKIFNSMSFETLIIKTPASKGFNALPPSVRAGGKPYR